MDAFVYCGFKIMDEAAYNLTRSYITLKKAWNCRVAMSSDKSFHVPLPLSVWGVVEPDHFHMDNHMNFVFHVELGKDGASGKIMGAAAYPGAFFRYTLLLLLIAAAASSRFLFSYIPVSSPPLLLFVPPTHA